MTIVGLGKLLGSGHITCHQTVNENGALLQLGVLAIVHDLHELLLKECLSLWSLFEEKLEHADEKSA